MLFYVHLFYFSQFASYLLYKNKTSLARSSIIFKNIKDYNLYLFFSMAGETPSADQPGRVIPVISVTRAEEDMQVDGQPTLDDMIEQQLEETDQEKQNMEALCSQVQSVELQPEPAADQGAAKHTFIVLSDVDIGRDRYHHLETEIRWVLLRRDTIKETVTVILNFISDPHPKGLVIMCFNRFWQFMGVPINDVMCAIRTIANKMSTVFIHNLVFSTAPFLPCMEKKWPQAASLNLFIRNINIELNRTPLGLHKSLLRKVKTLGKMAIKGDNFVEFREGTGVGKTFTPEAIGKMCRWIGNHCLRGMAHTVDHFTPLTVHDNEPECLSWTPGYKGDLMVGFIKQMGTFKPLPSSCVISPRYKRQQAQRNRDQRRDTLRPYLASIGRRPSVSSSSSNSSRRSSSGGMRVEEADLADQVRIVRLERDNQDLKNVLQTVKDKAEEERRDRRRGEETVSNTVQRLFGEIEWMIRDRIELSSKLTKAEQALIQMKEDRDAISDELARKKRE